MHSVDAARPWAGSPDELPVLPFAGLGFDLGPVRALAGACLAVRTRRAEIEVMANSSAEAWRPAGYALLIRLGREIRGR
jgi:hypothetical protein